MIISPDTSEGEESVLRKMSSQHIRVAVVGNVDAGKTTLVGTLISSTLDDGRGSNRKHAMKHRHELETGRTSDIGSHLLGFDAQGQSVIVKRGKKNAFEADVLKKSSKLVTLIDLAGHEKYLKTTVAGVSRGMADYAIVLVNASQPPTNMTKHHLNLCISSGIPVIVAITKIDKCPKHVYQHTKDAVNQMLRSPDVGLKPYRVTSMKDVGTACENLSVLAPIVPLSCVSGEGLDLLQAILFQLPQRRKHQSKRNKPFEFLIDDKFQITGAGTVLSGFVNRGQVKVGEDVFIGPLKDGTCINAQVKSIHVAQTGVSQAWAGHSACLALNLSKKSRDLVKPGMVAMKESITPTWKLEVEMFMVKGKTVTITPGTYEGTLHVLHMKFPGRVVDVKINGQSSTVSAIRQGGRAKLTFELIRRPQYLRQGMRVILRDGHVRGVGVIVQTWSTK